MKWPEIKQVVMKARYIIGVCIFAYGIAYYAEKTAIAKDGEKTERMNEGT